MGRTCGTRIAIKAWLAVGLDNRQGVMQVRVHARSKSGRRNHFKAYLAVGSLVAAAVLTVLILFSHYWDSRLDGILLSGAEREPSDPLGFSLLEPHSKEPRRFVYPYSVIPGGVGSAQELKEAILRDRVVAEHYAGFQGDRARIVKLTADKAVYVSYRIGNEVFWTRKKLKLVKGEGLITDGENYARARCGNRFSETPQPKTSPQEPSAKILETPQDPADREITGALVALSPHNSGTALRGLLLSSAPPPGGDGAVPIIPLVPIVGGSGPKGGTLPIGGPTPPNPPPDGGGTPLTPVPEPGTFLLLASGLAGCLGLRTKFN